MNKIFIIGSKGLLGSELIRQYQKTGLSVSGSDRADNGIDITKEQSILEYLNKEKPNTVINCAAFTNVDACETEEGFKIAREVNGYAVGKIAKVCQKLNINFVHISTDYVFGDNLKTGYTESYDNFKPLNKYGESKLIGELELFKIANRQGDTFLLDSPKVYLVRTSWLFGIGATNFINKIVDKIKNSNEIDVVTNEVSSPTYTKDLAKQVIYLLNNNYSGGIYHICGKGVYSRFEFAQEILNYYKNEIKLNPTKLENFFRIAKVPEYSSIINTKLLPSRNWQEMLADYLNNTKK